MAEGVVLDASAVVRGLTGEGSAAQVLDEVATGATTGHAPDLIVAEVANALVLAVRAGRYSLGDAHWLLGSFERSQVDLHATSPFTASAIEAAAERGLSAYDAFYAVLAEALEIPLVTADRRLATAVPGALLVA